MEFSRVYPTTAATPQLSPCGCYVAYVSQDLVHVRDVATLRLVRVHPCAGSVDTMQWCKDSNMIMCAEFAASAVEVSPGGKTATGIGPLGQK